MPHSRHPRPVLLVHGILGQRHLYWNVMRRRLERDGFRVHEASLPYTLLGDIRIAANALADKVEAVLRHSKARQVDLVCHSAGGLVARYFLKFLDGHRHVAHCVMLGTPHRGTWVSYSLPLLHVARQARPGARLLEELNGGEHPPTPVTNLWSRIDGVVVPAGNAVLHGPEHVANIEVPWTHHWAFLVSGRVYEQVRQALLEPSARGAPDAPKRRKAAKPGRPGKPRKAPRRAASA